MVETIKVYVDLPRMGSSVNIVFLHWLIYITYSSPKNDNINVMNIKFLIIVSPI